MSELKRTILYDCHLKSGAQMVIQRMVRLYFVSL